MGLARYTVTLVLLATLATAYHTGAPASRCDTMTPGHLFSGDTSEPPYTVTTDRRSYTTNGTLIVTIRANEGVTFKGFMLQARDQHNVGIGEFTALDSATQRVECPSVSAVTHVDKSLKTSKSFTWRAPAQPTGGAVVTFYTTFVKKFTTYWVMVPSATVAEAPHGESEQESHRVHYGDYVSAIPPEDTTDESKSVVQCLWDLIGSILN